MRVTLVPSQVDGGPPLQFLTTLLLNDSVALDAGCLGLSGGVAEQSRVKHVLLSHSHMDHVASLPIFLNNIFTGDCDCVTVYGSDFVLDCLRRDLFNDRLWPDFIRISAGGRPFLRLEELRAGDPITLDGLVVTPVPVNHVVPTFGFLIEDRTGAIAFSADTAPTEELWEVANATANLQAVFLEATFPNARALDADVSKHLTPSQFGVEVAKVKRAVPFHAVHIHPRGRAQVVQELVALGLPNVRVGQFGVPYQF